MIPQRVWQVTILAKWHDEVIYRQAQMQSKLQLALYDDFITAVLTMSSASSTTINCVTHGIFALRIY